MRAELTERQEDILLGLLGSLQITMDMEPRGKSTMYAPAGVSWGDYMNLSMAGYIHSGHNEYFGIVSITADGRTRAAEIIAARAAARQLAAEAGMAAPSP